MAYMQGKQLSFPGRDASLSKVERGGEAGKTELAFSAEGKVLSCRFFVCDGLVHDLPPAAKEVWTAKVLPLAHAYVIGPLERTISHIYAYTCTACTHILKTVEACEGLIAAEPAPDARVHDIIVEKPGKCDRYFSLMNAKRRDTPCISGDHMQVVGDDLHLTAIVGAKQMVEEAPEHGLDVAWVENADKPKHSHSVGEPMDVPALQIESFRNEGVVHWYVDVYIYYASQIRAWVSVHA